MSLDVRIVSTDAADPSEIAGAVTEQFRGLDPHLTVFFASTSVPFQPLASAIHDTVGGTSIGCTTAGEICAGRGLTRGSVVVMGIHSEELSLCGSLIRDAREFTVDRARAEVDTPRESGMLGPDMKSLGIVLIDGVSRAEEQVAATMAHTFRGMEFAGGSAGDDLGYEETYVACNGDVASNAAAIVIARTSLPFRVFHTHHYEVTDTKLVITAAAPSERRVIEFNGLPAAECYADVTGTRIEDFTPWLFAAHPLLLRVYGTPFVRSIRKVCDDGSLVFNCAIDEGLVLRIARMGDSRRALSDEIDSIRSQMDVAAVLGFDCVSRRLELDNVGGTEEINKLLSGLPIAGFSCYGETYNGLHVNQTLTGVALGRAS